MRVAAPPSLKPPTDRPTPAPEACSQGRNEPVSPAWLRARSAFPPPEPRSSDSGSSPRRSGTARGPGASRRNGPTGPCRQSAPNGRRFHRLLLASCTEGPSLAERASSWCPGGRWDHLEELLEALIASEPFERLLAFAGPRVARVPEGGQPYVAAALAHATEGPVLVVAPGPAEAERLARGGEAFLGRRRSVSFPAWEALPYEGISPGAEVAARRARAVHRARTAGGPFLLAAPA